METVVHASEKSIALSEKTALEMPSLTLAYIGDAVHTEYARFIQVMGGGRCTRVERLHKQSTAMVNAKNQSRIFDKLLPFLSETELSVIKRARNAKSDRQIRSASVAEYHKATGFEALLGFLYVTGDTERLNEILYYSQLSDEEVDKIIRETENK